MGSARNPDAARVDAHVGARLAELRARRGLTVTAVAARLGMTRQNVAGWEKGEAVSIHNLIRLCEVLQVGFDAFLGDLASVRAGVEEGPPAPTAEGAKLAALVAELPQRQRKLILDVARRIAEDAATG